MIRKFLIPLLALGGIGLALFTVLTGGEEPPTAQPVVEPAKAPYETFVAGSGIVECSTENIAIGTHIAGIVSEVHVIVGSLVNAGDPLFKIDDRSLKAEVGVRRAEVQVAEALLADSKAQFARADNLKDRRAISVEEFDRRRFATLVAEARLAEAQAQLEAAETNLELLTVRAPVEGEVLQLNVRVGEFAPTGALDKSLLIFGNVSTLHVRVDVDETDAWRVRAGASALAVLRGNPEIKTPLRFVRFEPYVVPKRSLTGESTERVDTRVLQILYSFDPGNLPIFVGQQLDVFIDAPSHAGDGRA